MPRARTRVVKSAENLAVSIPKAVADQAGLQEGDTILIDVSGRHSEHPIQRIPTLEELVAQITPGNRHEAIDWGPAVGKEIVEW